MGNLLKSVRKNRIQASVFKNKSAQGKPYLTIKINKSYKSRAGWVHDSMCMDRKEMGGLLWILGQLQDWMNSHM